MEMLVVPLSMERFHQRLFDTRPGRESRTRPY